MRLACLPDFQVLPCASTPQGSANGGSLGHAVCTGRIPLAWVLPCRAQVLIQGGELVMGTLCKKTLGASGGSLIHVIWMEEGPEAARAFLSQTQYLVNHWLLQHGFSIGIGDTVADAATMLIISDIINKARAGSPVGACAGANCSGSCKLGCQRFQGRASAHAMACKRATASVQAKSEVKQLTSKLQNREMEPQPGRTLMESFEAGVNQVRMQRVLGARGWLHVSGK